MITEEVCYTSHIYCTEKSFSADEYGASVGSTMEMDT